MAPDRSRLACMINGVLPGLDEYYSTRQLHRTSLRKAWLVLLIYLGGDLPAVQNICRALGVLSSPVPLMLIQEQCQANDPRFRPRYEYDLPFLTQCLSGRYSCSKESLLVYGFCLVFCLLHNWFLALRAQWNKLVGGFTRAKRVQNRAFQVQH